MLAGVLRLATAVLLIARADALGNACTLDADCKLTCADGLPMAFGAAVDLSGFTAHHNAEGYYTAVDTEPGDTYYVLACGPITSVSCADAPEGTPAALTSFAGGAGMPPHMETDCASCGEYRNQSCRVDVAEATITCGYPGGHPGQRSLEVRYVCGKAYTLPTAQQVDVGGKRIDHTITFRGPAACSIGGGAPGGDDVEGLSWGATLLLILLGGTAAYLGVGYAYNRNVRGVSGVDALPHIDFWQELPSRAAEGCARAAREVREVLRAWRRPEGVTEPLAPAVQPA